ncbi:hypothetical protein [Harryflintia acetispora]|uniref:hypothetical protein n=1 Tax=Harryflintia acetispora TaxID=1849041 RepID=UPI00189C242F|nr:hypothetical protein [Harryflintia acetispora]
MKKIRLYCLAALVLLGTLLAATAAAGAQAAGYQSVRGIEVEFTPSPRTGRYRFEVYEAGSQEAVCSKSFDSITRAQTVFLPVECLPETTYTIKVTTLPEPGREGLDTAASKEQAFIPQPVCGHTAAEGGFLYGSGTADDPYIVSSPAQLRHLDHDAHRRAGQYFLQSRDIDLLDPAFYQDGLPYDADSNSGNGNWVPIAKEHLSTDGFIGQYDGGGHSVKNLTYHATSTNCNAALFGYISGGSIQNLSVENFNFSCGNFGAAGFVGASHYAISVQRCRAVNGTLKGPSCGGISGYFHASWGNEVVSDCYSAGMQVTITNYESRYHAGGGIAGHMFRNPGNSVQLRNAYAIPNAMGGVVTPGAVLGSRYLDAAVSENYGSVSDSYYLSGSASYGIGSPASNSGAVPLGEAAFAAESSFPGWDFVDTWTMGTVTYTDASGSERTISAPVLQVFERQKNSARIQSAAPLKEASIGLSD